MLSALRLDQGKPLSCHDTRLKLMAFSGFTFSRYTALGDSYAAGDGPYMPFDHPDNIVCNRTTVSYPNTFFTKYSKSSDTFSFPACSGADTGHVLEQISSPEFGSPDLVSINVGGDNAGNLDFLRLGIFAEVVGACIEDNPLLDCQTEINNASFIIGQFGPVIDQVLQAAAKTNLAGGKRTVVLLGYMQFYNINAAISSCPPDNPNYPYTGWYQPSLGSGGVADKINQLVIAANTQLNESAIRNGALFVNTDAAFAGHRICDSEPWFQTPDKPPYASIMHPTADGYAAMAAAMANKLGM